MGKYKIRFNLGRGNNFKKWKITDMVTKEVIYLNPLENKLILSNSKLINKKNSSIKIYNGHNKYPCAWVECENYLISKNNLNTYERIFFNPKIKPNWYNNENEDLDNHFYHQLVTDGNKIYKGYM